ncbi:hypothetical protein CSA80_01775 [Candidatus Saccharibacteria bacterium]|nr:MAG: hypothetical protein CSA80_01775 [Candidatus Saccharibacteria bacterium]
MQWLSENKFGLMAVLLVVGFVAFIVFQDSGNKANVAASAFETVNSNSSMSRGAAAAPVSFIQYSDFLCPSCSYISIQVMPQVDKAFIDTGKVKYEFRPMAFIAEGSVQAGMGAYCAVDQDKFWTYHDNVYRYVAKRVFQDGLDPKSDIILTGDLVKKIALESGLDGPIFSECLDSKKHLSDITAATNEANKNGVASTPYLLVNGTPVRGNPTFETISALIQARL